MFFVTFYLAEGSFLISLMLGCLCVSAQAEGWEPILDLEKAPCFPPRGCSFGSHPSQGTLRVLVRESGCRCEPAGSRAATQQTSPEGKITEEKNINNANTGHNRRSSLKYLKLGELKVISLHHDILSKVIIINLLLI